MEKGDETVGSATNIRHMCCVICMSLLFADDEDGGANEAHSWAKKVLKVFMPVSLSIFSLVSLRIFESIQVHTAVKMETFVVGVAPPLPRLNITATTEDLHKSPQLYFAVRSAIHSATW